MCLALRVGECRHLCDPDLVHDEVHLAAVDGGYSHEFTSAQVHNFLLAEYGPNYKIINSHKFAAFEDHLIYADQVNNYIKFYLVLKSL